MSFSMPFINLPEFTGEGPLADIFSALTTDSILLYIGTWIVFLKTQVWFQWLVYIGVFYVAIRVIINLIAAFRNRGAVVDD